MCQLKINWTSTPSYVSFTVLERALLQRGNRFFFLQGLFSASSSGKNILSLLNPHMHFLLIMRKSVENRGNKGNTCECVQKQFNFDKMKPKLVFCTMLGNPLAP